MDRDATLRGGSDAGWLSGLAISARQSVPACSNWRETEEQPFDLVITRYALERLLYRLSQSGYRHRFALKGAMLITTWFPIRTARHETSICWASAIPGRNPYLASSARSAECRRMTALYSS